MNDIQCRSIYTLNVNVIQVRQLLKVIKKIPININVVMESVINECDNYQIKIVVGTVDPTSTERGGATSKSNTNQQQNKVFVKILEALNIKYKINHVVQILNFQNVSHTPGLLYAFFNSLYCSDIDVKYSEFTFEGPYKVPLVPCECGESEYTKTSTITQIFEISERQLEKSIKVLKKVDIDSQNICINKFDIGKTICGRCGPEIIL